MRIPKIAMVAIVLAASAFAADLTGDWTAQVGGPDGNGMAITFHFKQDGSKLTGSIDGPQGDPMPISEGKVDGDKISFTVKFDRSGGEGMKIQHSGKLEGEEITLSIKMEGGPGGEGPGPGGQGSGGPMKLKRAK